MVLKFELIHFQDVKCEDTDLQSVLQTAVTKLHQAITPIKPSSSLVLSNYTPQPGVSSDKK